MEIKILEIFAYRTVTDVHFTDQNQISKTVYNIRNVMVFKIGFTNWNAKIALLRASMVVLNFSERKRKADRQNSILMSLLPLLLMFCKDISQKFFDGATVKNL